MAPVFDVVRAGGRCTGAEAVEAAEFYVSLFPDSRMIGTVPYPEGAPGTAGGPMVVEFELWGQRFVAINGFTDFPFTEAISLEVRCADQAEVDRYWAALTDGGEEGMCGWCKDRYGLSWQVVPVGWEEILTGDDPEAASRAVQAMLGMRKLDLAALRAAAAGTA